MQTMILNSPAPGELVDNGNYQLFIPQDVCAKAIRFSVVDGKLTGVEFASGCPGNLQGIAKLVEGLAPEQVVERLKGITCGRKSTSCPDQFAIALETYMHRGM